MAHPKSLILFSLLFSLSCVSFAQSSTTDAQDFDAVVEEGNPLKEENSVGAPMPAKDLGKGLVEPIPEKPAGPAPIEEGFFDQDDSEPVVESPEIEGVETAPGPIAPNEEFAEEDPVDVQPEPLPVIRQKPTPITRRKNSRYIQHPNSDKGLIKIDKNRVYYYRAPESPKNFSISFRAGMYEPSELENPDQAGATYSNVYGDTSSFPLLLFDYEKQLFKNYEDLRYYLGGGFFYAEGSGQFDLSGGQPQPPESPLEEFSLFVFPISAGVNWSLNFFKNQWLVPYGGGGVTAFVFGERRDDDLNPALGAKWGISPAAHFQFGGRMKLGSGPRAFLDLDREYGINSMWLTVEYKNYIALSDKFDFSSDFIGGGLYLVY